MRKLILVLSVLFPTLAFAQGGLNPIAVNGSNVSVNVPSGGSFAVVQGTTTRELIDTSGNTVHPAYVITAAAAATPGVHDIAGYVNIVPTAAADTQAFLPASPTAGLTKFIMNHGGAGAFRVRAPLTATMNSVGTPGAGQYIAVPLKNGAVCVATSSTNYHCSLLVVPTPA